MKLEVFKARNKMLKMFQDNAEWKRFIIGFSLFFSGDRVCVSARTPFLHITRLRGGEQETVASVYTRFHCTMKSEHKVCWMLIDDKDCLLLCVWEKSWISCLGNKMGFFYARPVERE